MKASYRPRVRNGQINRRPVRASFPARVGWMPRSRRPNAIWILVAVAAVVACGFLASLRWQMRAHYTGREEVRLKSKLNQAESEQRYLVLEQTGNLTPREIERATNKRGGLAPTTLDEPSALRIPYQLAAQQTRARERERRESVKERGNETSTGNPNVAAATGVTTPPPQ